MWLNKSILGRVFVYFILFCFLASSFLFLMGSVQMQAVSLDIYAASLLIFLLYFVLVYLYEIVRPLNLILKEMKALLTGGRYRKIITKRVDEIGIIAHFFNEVTRSIEKISVDIQEGKRIVSELETASSIQRMIMPPRNPHVPGLDIVAKTRPAAELGGDNFDFITKGDYTYIYIGDVTGHGVPAAIVMTMVHTLIHVLADTSYSPYEIVVNTNTQLKSRIKSTMFMTMLFLRWDQKNEKMTYVGAGHEHLLIYKAAIGKCDVRPTGGIALGMVPDNSKLIREIDLPLEIGDFVVLYTDGLTEGRNMSGEMYGLERLVHAIELYAERYGADGLVHHIAVDYSKFVQDHVQDDDVTLIAVKYIGKGAEEQKLLSGINSATMSWLNTEVDQTALQKDNPLQDDIK